MGNVPIVASTDYSAIVVKLLKQLHKVVADFSNPDNARDTIRLNEIVLFAKRILGEQYSEEMFK